MPERGEFLVAADLDRTLIYSAAALGLDSGARPPALVVAEVYQGAPISFLTRRAQDLLAELAAVATFVPVTTRTLAQYSRVHLLAAPPRYAVTTNGARIVVDGVVDQDWTDALTARLAGLCAPIGEIDAHLRKVADPRWTRSHRIAEDIFAYLVVDRAELAAAFVTDLSAWCAAAGWTVSLQGRKLYAVPSALTKSAAVAEVAARTGTPTVLAAGDALLDADLLTYAEVGMRPAHGELHDLGWTRPHVSVTGASGVLAAEQILEAFLVTCTGCGR
ncbi:MAG: HAD family hydrolase [Sporichthyaceae bacterium]